MGQDSSTGGPRMTDAQGPEQIKEQIEATREELGDPVEALTAKTDVKAQTKRKIEETKASVTDKTQELSGKAKQSSPDAAVAAASGLSRKAQENPVAVAVAGAFAFGFLAGRLTRDYPGGGGRWARRLERPRGGTGGSRQTGVRREDQFAFA